jgi:hypothetical protein
MRHFYLSTSTPALVLMESFIALVHAITECDCLGRSIARMQTSPEKCAAPCTSKTAVPEDGRTPMQVYPAN